MRFHLFEFEDLKWFPEPVRSGATDYLRFLLKALRFYEPAAQMIACETQKKNEHAILDLCSGGGGPAQHISAILPTNIHLILSDKFPNPKAWKYIESVSKNKISYLENPVDAFSEKELIKGPRTMFSAVHHFKPEQISRIIKNCAEREHSIFFFDGGNKNIFMVLGLLIIHPILTVTSAPFLKPFRFSRIVFTWLLPLIPLVTVWDGFVSILRLYKPKQLMKFAQLAVPEYEWKAGYIKSRFGLRIAFLCGSSLRSNDQAISNN